MKNHAEVLGETGDVYKDMNINDKKMHERLRKRTNRLLLNEQTAQSQSLSKTSSIEEEYQSDILDPGGSSSENEEDPDKIANELNMFPKKSKRGITSMCLIRLSTYLNWENPLHPPCVLSRGKEKKNGEKTSKKTAKRPKSARKPAKKSANEKLDALLDKLPALLENANKAAMAHRKALGKWERKQGLDESDENDFSNEDE
ncbi:hypothetical protein OS493_011540 [Desmophyllum pertusum]|uniref:Uncharacterized protein n=1 Tax=Desmophyllum pertusum TaxID=174260 RepID=A0A9W9YTH2_9CNID|nr:hypothetical protein OS493_011540 [Desmophyllum pertusum]